MSVSLSSPRSNYTNGKMFGRPILKPCQRDQLPEDLVEPLYVPSYSSVVIPPVITSDFIRGAVEPSLCFEENCIVFHVVNKVSPIIKKWLIDRNIGTESSPAGRLDRYTIRGPDALDFLSLVYDSSTPQTCDTSKYERYLSMCNAHQITSGCIKDPIQQFKLPMFKVVRVDVNAIIPSKKRASDVGFDLTLIRKVKDIGSKSALYDTGLIIQPPQGYYIEVVPRSSLSKSGYIQSNSIGIIDPNYLDTFKVPLTRVDDTLPALTLPFTGFQLIIRRPYHGLMVECKQEDLVQTSRDTGGFGSTGGLNQHAQTVLPNPPEPFTPMTEIKIEQ